MARSSYAFATLPALCFAVACATAVDQGFVNDDEGDDTGGSQSSPQGGLSSSAGQPATGGGPANGSGGKPTSAFGGTNSGSAGGAPGVSGQAGMPNGGASAGAGGKASGGAGGTSSGAGAGGKANGGAGGSSASAGMGGVSGATGGTGSAGSAGTSSTGGSPATTGDCAPAGTGWVVQFWTSSGTANMPTGDVRIFNNAGGAVNFNTLELRHYFTNEETASLSFVFPSFGHNLPSAPYYEDEGGANVLGSIKSVTPAATNASHYISIKFSATPGNFGNGETAQVGYYGSLAMYPMKSNQANDYTYVGHPTSDPGSANKNTGWNRITLYAGGKLVWGCEP